MLLAEDSPDNQVLISRILQRGGAEIELVENGELALNRILEQPAAYDAVLMDMQMPVMDGYTAVAKLRDAGWSGTVIALTANTMKGDAQKCLEAGCNDYSTKPIDRPHLFGLLRKYIAKAKSK